MPIGFGVYEFDPSSGDLRREGRPVRLQPQPARMLAALVAPIRSAVARHLEQTSADVLQVGESSLYPALQRLLVSGWATAEWDATDSGRRARFYRITAAGRKRLAAEAAGFERIVGAIVRDVRYCLRSLARSPGFTLVALTIASHGSTRPGPATSRASAFRSCSDATSPSATCWVLPASRS